MSFITNITQKGQVTIPKKMRGKAGIKPKGKVKIEQDKNGKIIITPAVTLLDLAGTFIPRANKDKSALEAREYMEENYERV